MVRKEVEFVSHTAGVTIGSNRGGLWVWHISAL